MKCQKTKKLFFLKSYFTQPLLLRCSMKSVPGILKTIFLLKNENKPQGVIVVHCENKIAKILR